mmetsp:Transcript_69629/g.167096  ORF Transcript_69629/g.167096 Transcript_69629/m.167096 type:complete len:211 (+) Transcript_69629:2071-2703(+)
MSVGASPTRGDADAGEPDGTADIVLVIIRMALCSEEISLARPIGTRSPPSPSTPVSMKASSVSLIFVHMSISTSMSSKGTSFCSKAKLIVDAMCVMAPSPLECMKPCVMVVTCDVVDDIRAISKSSSSSVESRSRSGRSSVINWASSALLLSNARSVMALGVATMLEAPSLFVLSLIVGRMRGKVRSGLPATGERACTSGSSLTTTFLRG